MAKYLTVFFISMVPIIELRGAMLLVVADPDCQLIPALILCIIGNMLPVPFIYFFARKVLVWGAHKRFIGKFFRFCLEKGERTGQKLVAKTGRGGLFLALMLFVGIPLPGTGAWTGTLGASFLDMGFKSTVLSVCLGVIIAGVAIGVGGEAVLHILG